MEKSNSNPVPVTDHNKINLDNHLVIEASAGTGKTYTIEQLVVNLLYQGKVQSLDEILVVTFTEKAAGELKERIRNIISEKLNEHKSQILKQSLDNFDSASIYTIHGFCNKNIRDFAFENKEQFQHELIDDREIYSKMLHQEKKQNWPAKYQKHLPEILKISNYPAKTASGRSSWEELALNIAYRYRPEADDILYPEPDLHFYSRINIYEDHVNNCLDELIESIGPINFEDVAASEFYIKYSSLNIHKRKIIKKQTLIRNILELLKNHLKEGKTSLFQYCIFYNKLKLDDTGFTILNTGWNNPGPDFRDILPGLEDIITKLNSLLKIDIQALQHQLTVNTIITLKEKVSTHNREKGFLSYDDMILRLYLSLIDETREIRTVLQKRYKYALVDEFQDTDILQWKIFKTIFLEGTKNILITIGDPKQAIYGFRGAELNAYYTAKNEMIQIYNAEYYSLNENWRSDSSLITFFNSFFGSYAWFTDTNIHYSDSFYPSKKEPVKEKNDNVFLIELGICSGSEARVKMARYTASEIEKLLFHPNEDIKPEEIAILIKKWNEADVIENALKERNIRYSYYKKGGLYQSREALDIIYILSSIAQPANSVLKKKSLLTRFFNIPVTMLHKFEDISSENKISVLFDKWFHLSNQRQWSSLFDSILSDTGILFRYKSEMQEKRILLNYVTIFQNILTEAYSSNHTIFDIIEFLNNCRNYHNTSDETFNLQTIDIENPGVQIMTIHASKGLEFKTVFIAGGFTSGKSPDYFTYHEKGRRVFNLIKNTESRQKYEKELEEEDERLFYVAFTRAREKLYIPDFIPSQYSKGTSGIIGKRIHNHIETLKKMNIFSVIEYKPESYKKIILDSNDNPITELPFNLDDLLSQKSVSFINRRININSFSEIKARIFGHDYSAVPGISFNNSQELLPQEDDETKINIDPVPLDNELSSIIGLPPSRETGLMLHEILEEIDYSIIDKASAISELEKITTITQIMQFKIEKYFQNLNDEDLKFYLAETLTLLWKTLRTPLNNTGFSLSKLSGSSRIHEMEFHLKVTDEHKSAVPEVTYLDSNVLHGFIDLIFIYDNRFYILDWKSNFLAEGYSADTIKKNIRTSHYDLQYQIYTLALIKWLKQLYPDYEYDKHFGGIYYIYLRGMDIESPENGVYYFRSNKEIM